MNARENFPVEVAIRRVSDGLVRAFAYEYGSRDDEGRYEDYLWSEGNYACDCNRGLWFAWAAGEDDPNRECGETAYGIEWIKDAATGEILYSESPAHISA